MLIIPVPDSSANRRRKVSFLFGLIKGIFKLGCGCYLLAVGVFLVLGSLVILIFDSSTFLEWGYLALTLGVILLVFFALLIKK